MDKPGFIGVRHFTTYVEEVRGLKRAGRLDEAAGILHQLVDATEAEAHANGWGVAPWYYEQLAIICAKRGDKPGELSILDRYERQPKAPGARPSKLAERLARLRRRLNQ